MWPGPGSSVPASAGFGRVGSTVRAYSSVCGSPGTSGCSDQRSAVASASYVANGRNEAGNGSPAVWLDEDDGSIVIQGWKIADERTMSEITATKPIPDHETVVRVPARMAAFLMEACGGGTTGVRPAPRG
jgi:hypothetical protein